MGDVLLPFGVLLRFPPPGKDLGWRGWADPSAAAGTHGCAPHIPAPLHQGSPGPHGDFGEHPRVSRARPSRDTNLKGFGVRGTL